MNANQKSWLGTKEFFASFTGTTITHMPREPDADIIPLHRDRRSFHVVEKRVADLMATIREQQSKQVWNDTQKAEILKAAQAQLDDLVAEHEADVEVLETATHTKIGALEAERADILRVKNEAQKHLAEIISEYTEPTR